MHLRNQSIKVFLTRMKKRRYSEMEIKRRLKPLAHHTKFLVGLVGTKKNRGGGGGANFSFICLFITLGQVRLGYIGYWVAPQG